MYGQVKGAKEEWRWHGPYKEENPEIWACLVDARPYATLRTRHTHTLPPDAQWGWHNPIRAKSLINGVLHPRLRLTHDKLHGRPPPPSPPRP